MQSTSQHGPVDPPQHPVSGSTLSDPLPYVEAALPGLPLILGRVQAGFPSPCDDYVEEQLDLRDLIKRPASTFFIRAIGDSMIGVGIRDGDLLVVDRAEMPLVRRVVVASTPDGLTVKVLVRRRGRFFLAPANERYPLIPVTGETEIWGVVIHVIHSFV